MAATRRRWVAAAAGQSVRKDSTVSGSAGSSASPVVRRQSVNRAQSPAYARTVAGDKEVGVDIPCRVTGGAVGVAGEVRRIPDNALLTTSDLPGASRPAAVWNWLMVDTHRVNVAGA